MLYKKAVIIIVMILIAGVQLFSIHEDAGTTGFAFLKFQISPRAAALGNAFTGLADDAEPDTLSLLGFDDDVAVLNYVLDQVGATELKISL